MKFTDYFILEANKKEKSSIEQDSNIILGTELEFCMKNMSIHNDIADFLKTKTNIEFDYSYDTSIKTRDDIDGSIEIQTIPKSWKEFQEEIQEFLGLIQKYGYTNDSCGMHITINYIDFKLPEDFGDKLRLSMQDPKAHKYFPSRRNSDYTKSRKEQDANYYSKYYSFRIRKGTNQVEFRIIGGKDYEYKWNEIRNLILDYMVKYKNSLLDPEFMKKKRLISKVKVIQDPKSAYKYALDVIKGRWPEAEQYIATDPEYAYLYAKNVIRDRFPEAESNISKDHERAYDYAKDIIKGRFPEAEQYISKDPFYSYRYALYIIKGRFPEAEQYISKDPFYSYYYARNIIKKRFPEAESVIMKNPKLAYLYAKDVIKDRFPEAESFIAKDKQYFDLYKTNIIK